MYKDKGVNLIGKIFHVEKEEGLTDPSFIKGLVQTVLANLSIGIESIEDKYSVSQEENYLSFLFSEESATVLVEAFKEEKSVFVSLFIRKKCNISVLNKQFKLILQNYGAKSMNYQIFYRP